MLPITLDIQRTESIPQKGGNNLNYEIEVVNRGPQAEVKLYFLSSAKKKTKKSSKPLPKYETIFLFNT
jgi:hypothetical protein